MSSSSTTLGTASAKTDFNVRSRAGGARRLKLKKVMDQMVGSSVRLADMNFRVIG